MQYLRQCSTDPHPPTWSTLIACEENSSQAWMLLLGTVGSANSCTQRQMRIIRRCFSLQVAALDLPFSNSYRLMLSPPDFATLYSLILHLTRLENWTRTVSVDPYHQCPYCTQSNSCHDLMLLLTELSHSSNSLANHHTALQISKVGYAYVLTINQKNNYQQSECESHENTQRLCWHDIASSSEWIPRLEVHSTCNYDNCLLLFFGLHFCWSRWSGSLVFTHAPWVLNE